MPIPTLASLSLRRAGFAFFAIACVVACEKKTPPNGAPDGAADAARHVSPDTSTRPTLSPGPEVEKACYSLAKARCTKLSACPTFDLTAGPGYACLAVTTDVCVYAYAPKESGQAVADIEKCTTEQASASCSDRLADVFPKCQRAAGTIAEGKACTSDAQCSTQLCVHEANRACGTCASATKEGEDCKQERCGPGGLACVAKKCVKRGAAGEPCAGPGACDANLVCASGKCTEPLAAGATCDPEGKTTAECDGSVGLYCDRTAKVCKTFLVGKPGDDCGDKAPTKRCRADTSCTKGKCVEHIRREQLCGPDAVCDPSSRCIDNRCRIPDLATCK